MDLARLLIHVLDDEEAALTVYERAAASGDADLSAEAMYEIAFVHVSHRDAAAARAMFERVIGTRHPVWAAAAMVGLASVLKRWDDPEGAEALYREAIGAGDADWPAWMPLAPFSLASRTHSAGPGGSHLNCCPPIAEHSFRLPTTA
jgi:hypothetical protein